MGRVLPTERGERGALTSYTKINRYCLAFYAMCACYFIAVQEYQAALGMVILWIFSKGILSIADVFYTFFTERPLFAAADGFVEVIPPGDTPRTS